MRNRSILRILPLLTLTACHSVPPLTWSQKEVKYGPLCEKLGHDRGSPAFLTCIAEQHQKECADTKIQEKRRKRTKLTAPHDSSALWKRNKVEGTHISDSPPQTTPGGLNWSYPYE